MTSTNQGVARLRAKLAEQGLTPAQIATVFKKARVSNTTVSDSPSLGNLAINARVAKAIEELNNPSIA